MSCRSTPLGSLFLGLALVAAAPPDGRTQGPPPSTDPASPTTVPAERIEVRLAQFDVVVRDKSGALVTGLPPTAFKVLEDGSPLEIVAVDEWGLSRQPPAPATNATATELSVSSAERTSGSTAAKNPTERSEPERRSFVLVFDALGPSTALRMNQAKRAADKFVRSYLRPSDLAAVYQLDLSLRAMSGVTSNLDDITRGIDQITWMSTSSLQDDIADSVLSSASVGSAPMMSQRLGNLSVTAAEQLDWQREHVYDALSSLAALFRGLPGRRVLVLASPGFPMTTPGDAKTGAGGFTPKFKELIRSLASYGITVYSLDTGNDLAAGDASEKIDWRIAVGKLGMDENTLADLGLERSLGTNSASARREFLGVIAAESGGRMLTQTDFSKAFAAIQEESSRFYRISCRVPVTRSADRYRKLLVTVSTPGTVVTGRRGRYSDITPREAAPPSDTTSIESVDRYRPIATRGIAFPLPGSDPKRVPVGVVIEALGPIDLPTNAQGGAALDVEFRLVARADGEVVDRYSRSFTARVKPDGVAAIRRAFRTEGRLALVPGIYDIQGTVRLGDPPQLATWSSRVAVPPPPKGTVPAFVTVVLTSESADESPLLSRPPIPDLSDPLVLKSGVRILPTTRTDLEAGGSLLALFWLRGLPDDAEKPPSLDLSVEIADGEGHTVSPAATILFFGKEPSGGYRGMVQMSTASLTAGAWSLRLGAKATGSELPPARQSVPFVLRAAEPQAATSVSAGSP